MADKLFNIGLGQLNPGLSSRSRNPVVRQSTITDDPMAIYKKSVRNSVASDSLEGVSVLRAIVLGASKQDSEEGWLSRILPFLGSDSEHTVTHLVCMIPEIHAHLGNPFDFFSSPTEYARRAMRFPVYDYQTEGDEDSIEVGIGSIVEVTFTDPDRTQGFVSRIIQPLDELLEIVQGTKDAHSRGDAIPSAPGGPAVYDEGFNPDEAVYPGSKYTWRMVTTTNTGLNNTPVDQSARNNLVNLTKNVLEKLDAANISFNINSAYRSPEVNTAAKGAKDSYHMKGSGVDLHFTGADKSNRKRQVEMFEKDIPEAIGSWHKMFIYEDTNHIHISAGGSSKRLLVHTEQGDYINWGSYKGPLSSHKTNKGNA